MEIKKLLLLLITFFIFSPVFSQEAAEEKPVVNQTAQVEAATEPSVKDNATSEPPVAAEETWQYLEWEEPDKDFVLKYNIVIEKQDSKTQEWSEVRNFETKDNASKVQITPRLEPGYYRYKVATYNLLGLADVESDWKTFTIFQAYTPAVKSVKIKSTLASTMFLEEINDGIFTVEGKNLFTNKESESDTSFTTYSFVSQKKNKEPIIPEVIEHDDDNKKVIIKFNMEDLDTGTYNLLSTDASGLKNEANEDNQIIIKFKKWLDIDLSAGYSCPVTLFDDTFKTYLDSSTWPLSASAKLSVMPFKHRYGYLGLGVFGNYTKVFHIFDTYTIDGNFIFMHANFIYQLPIYFNNGGKRRHAMTLEAHGGAGFTYLANFAFHYENGIDSEPLNSNNLSFMAGGAVQYYFTTRLYIEANVDFIVSFLSDMSLGTLVPSISAGWQF